MDNASNENWPVLASLFPAGWDGKATETGAISRQRGITDPETLLRLFLLHVARGYSLLETSVRAKGSGLAHISAVGLMKRLQRSEDWLRWLCTELVAENGVRMPGRQTGAVRLVDGTIVKEAGKTGSQWRIVYSLRLPDLYCDYFKLTPTTGAGTGESFAQVPVHPGDLMLGDAGYGSSASVRSVVDSGGDVLVRITSQTLPLFDAKANRLDLLALFRQLSEAGRAGQWPAVIEDGSVKGRICAIRKSEEAIAKAHRRIQRRASRKQFQTREATLEHAKYVAIFTTDTAAPPETILEWYRVRWQIELLFKRLKSLSHLGHLPKHDEQSSRAWLYGKLLVALLTQKLVRTGRELSPWGYLLPSRSTSQ